MYYCERTGVRRRRRRRLRAAALAAVFLLICFLAGLAVGSVINAIQNRAAESPDFAAVLESLPDEEGYIAHLAPRLNDGVWKGLDREEKLELLRLICDWETVKVLGCTPTYVKVSEEMEKNNLAFYDRNSHTITINADTLDNAGWQTVVETLCHECRHCWQRDMIELLAEVEESGSEHRNLYIFNSVRDFRETWDNYISGLEDFEGYYAQSIEADCRVWGGERMEGYYLEIVKGAYN